MLQAINIPQCVRTPHDVDIRLHSTSDIEAGQGTLQEGNPNGTISDQSGILTQILLEPVGVRTFSRPACLGPTSIVSLGIMCVWALGQAVQKLSH